MIKNMRKHPNKGDWQRDQVIVGFLQRITWKNVNRNHFVIKTPVPCGMTGLVAKLQSTSAKSSEGLPLSVKKHFQVEEQADFSTKDVTVEVSFSGRYCACVFLFQLLTLLKYRRNGIDIDMLRAVFYMHNLNCIRHAFQNSPSPQHSSLKMFFYYLKFLKVFRIFVVMF